RIAVADGADHAGHAPDSPLRPRRRAAQESRRSVSLVGPPLRNLRRGSDWWLRAAGRRIERLPERQQPRYSIHVAAAVQSRTDGQRRRQKRHRTALNAAVAIDVPHISANFPLSFVISAKLHVSSSTSNGRALTVIGRRTTSLSAV